MNVEESDRLSFLPYLFGDDFMIAEMQVYALARKMITGYEGGFWHFIRLPDGGGYMMPDCGPVHLTNSENWFDSTVSADAAGIILTSLAINRRLKQQSEECLQKDKKVRRQTRVTRRQMTPDEIDPKILALGCHIVRRCSKQQRVHVPAMRSGEWGHLLRALEMKRAWN